MKESIKSIMEWHEQTFPDATIVGQIHKFNEELKEYKESGKISELVDMFVVACGTARFNYIIAMKYFSIVFVLLCATEIKSGDFYLMVDDKMAKNRRRVWNKTGEGVYHHKNGIED